MNPIILMEVVPQPGKCFRSTKYYELVEALMGLAPGEALRVPMGTFGGRKTPAEASLQMKRRCGRKLHQRRLPDGIYLWLDPVDEGGAK